jgi:hypothetical protein
MSAKSRDIRKGTYSGTATLRWHKV